MTHIIKYLTIRLYSLVFSEQQEIIVMHNIMIVLLCITMISSCLLNIVTISNTLCLLLIKAHLVPAQ